MRKPRELWRAPPNARAQAWLGATGVFFAALLAATSNLLVARHYQRWDWTKDALYTPSQATLDTLAAIREPVEIISLLPRADVTFLSVEQTLQACGARSRLLRLSFIDPDTNPGAFLSLQEELGLRAGRSEEGTPLSEVALIVRRGSHHWLVSPEELVIHEEGTEEARPAVEQALIHALQNVLVDERPVVCFSSGHDEISTDDVSPTGLAELARQLESGGKTVKTVGLGGPHPESLAGCRLVVLAAPDEPLSSLASKHVADYLLSGGSVLVLATAGLDERGHVDQRGLGPLLETAGLTAESRVVIEADPQRVLTGSFGETFVAQPLPHDVTRALFRRGEAELGVVATLALPITSKQLFDAKPLLTASEHAYSTSSLSSMVERGELPTPPARPQDTDPSQPHEGAPRVAWAVELPARDGQTAKRHPRLIVAPASVGFGRNWRESQWAGTRRFAEGALAWLLEQPVPLSVPERPDRRVGLSLTEGELQRVALWVLLWMPGAALGLGGLVLYLRRRHPNRKPPAPPAKREAVPPEESP